MIWHDDHCAVFSFGGFSVDAEERVLFRGSEPIPLTPRVFELLLAFLHQPGTILTKEELLTTVWREKFVEESNIVQNVAILRRALDDSATEAKFIATVTSRGYRFIAPVTV